LVKKVARNFKIFLILIFASNFLEGQVDRRFNTFDWQILGENQSINSVTEGYQFFYFASSGNGILRFNKFSRSFDINISQAQGLKSEIIEHVYFDEYTGILWSVGNQSLEFSQTRDGNWSNIDLGSLSIKNYEDVIDIGSSKNFLWIKTYQGYIKLDHISGSFLGVSSFPDDDDIFWGDISKNNLILANLDFSDYYVTDNWFLSQKGVNDDQGLFSNFTSFLSSKDGNLSWLTLDNGYMMIVEEFSKTISPVTSGIGSAIPTTISSQDYRWVAGISSNKTKVITKLDNDFNEISFLKSSEYSNFSNSNIFSSLIIEDEIWFGGNGLVIIYNKKKDFFRTMGFEKGVPQGRIRYLKVMGDNIYLSSINGVAVINYKTKEKVFSPISNFVFSRNLVVRSLELHDNKIKFATNSGIFELSNDNSIGIIDRNRNYTYLLKTLESNLYSVNDTGILLNGNKIINSAEYFNYEVNDLFVENNIIYIGTNNALIVYNLSENFVQNMYEFSFLKKIMKIDKIDEFLILLTSKGLVKFRL
tara:strand:+ start:1877 stop:3469 length:1593 start_codon:yes stop_codon:yes gene_type:complete